MSSQGARLQIHLSAKDLKNLSSGMFGGGKSDPFAVVTIRGDSVDNPPTILGATDVVFNSLNPSWSRTIFVEGYKFGVPCYIEVGVFDFNAAQTGKSESELSRMDTHSQFLLTSNAANRALLRDGKFPHKVMGTALFEIGQILGNRSNGASKSLQSGGAVFVHIERSQTASEDRGRIHLQLRGVALTNVQSLGRTSSPFYELYRKVDRPTGASWLSVYRSNVCRADLSPVWAEASLDLESTCNGDLDRAVKIIVWDHRRTGKHKMIGECETTLRALVNAADSVRALEQSYSQVNLTTSNPTTSNHHHHHNRRPSSKDSNTSTDEDDEYAFQLFKLDQQVGTLQVVEATLSGPDNRSSFSAKRLLSSSTMRNNGTGTMAKELTPVMEGSHSNDDQNEEQPPPERAGKKPGEDDDDDASLPPPEAQEGAGKSSARGQPSQHSHRSVPRPDFVDYLAGGCQISLAVAIDFTASNGDPRQPNTPHYFHPPESKEWNDYEKAIFAVGSILAKYDSDQRFPVWGFGAKYNGVVRHCFQCGTEVEVDGVQGIMDAYRGVFRTPLTMSFPTKFTEVIQTAASYARHEQELAEEEGVLSYTILLILTAGNVENMVDTKQQLIDASTEPLSVVIVGIGDAEFQGMEFLDEHDPQVEDGRDITKFVRFSDYKSFNALTEAVLDEIPEQLVTYFFDRGVMPGKSTGFDESQVEIEAADDESRTYTFLG